METNNTICLAPIREETRGQIRNLRHLENMVFQENYLNLKVWELVCLTTWLTNKKNFEIKTNPRRVKISADI